MELLKHLWSIRHAELYWTGTTIRISLFRYILVALVIPNSVWERINARVKGSQDRAEEAEEKNKRFSKHNLSLLEEVADLKSRLAKALTSEHPDAKR
jgi:hypothetical protein